MNPMITMLEVLQSIKKDIEVFEPIKTEEHTAKASAIAKIDVLLAIVKGGC